MLNIERRRQFLELMSEQGWDVLLLYGHSWRKDFFRSLVNFNFFGPHAVAALTRSGELTVVLSHPWDHELLSNKLDSTVKWSANFSAVIRRLSSGKTAIAGREFMEARFVDDATISATAAIETLRRFKTPEEVEFVKQAAKLADDGYRHFVETAETGLAEYELVAEIEGFLKTHGAPRTTSC
jgi:Xaa-Pro aminopeptidase